MKNRELPLTGLEAGKSSQGVVSEEIATSSQDGEPKGNPQWKVTFMAGVLVWYQVTPTSVALTYSQGLTQAIPLIQVCT